MGELSSYREGTIIFFTASATRNKWRIACWTSWNPLFVPFECCIAKILEFYACTRSFNFGRRLQVFTIAERCDCFWEFQRKGKFSEVKQCTAIFCCQSSLSRTIWSANNTFCWQANRSWVFFKPSFTLSIWQAPQNNQEIHKFRLDCTPIRQFISEHLCLWQITSGGGWIWAGMFFDNSSHTTFAFRRVRENNSHESHYWSQGSRQPMSTFTFSLLCMRIPAHLKWFSCLFRCFWPNFPHHLFPTKRQSFSIQKANWLTLRLFGVLFLDLHPFLLEILNSVHVPWVTGWNLPRVLATASSALQNAWHLPEEFSSLCRASSDSRTPEQPWIEFEFRGRLTFRNFRQRWQATFLLSKLTRCSSDPPKRASKR